MVSKPETPGTGFATGIWPTRSSCRGFFDDWTEVLMAADAYVHPLQTDASCGALVRALASGTCTVATQNSNTQRLIEKNVNGLLTPPANPAALAEALILALDDTELRNRLGSAARERAIAECNIEKTAAAYLSSIDAVCQS